MDVSIVAAIGSFIVSERVIKAKATVLVGALCIVCYDLFIHTNDPISLRVYRGPALIAISMVMSAFCLRTWRRNGIACDELIFLPGSLHAEKSENTNNERSLPLNLRLIDQELNNTASIGSGCGSDTSSSFISPAAPVVDLSSVDSHDEEYCGPESEMVPLKKNSGVEDCVSNNGAVEEPPRHRPWLFLGKSVCRARGSASRSASPKRKSQKDSRGGSPRRPESKGLARFFSSQETNEYAPSGPIVASAGVDLCLPVLTNFHLFMMATHSHDPKEDDVIDLISYDDMFERDFPKFEESEMSIPPQVLPLIFLSILMIRSAFPRKARKRFWGTIHSAIFSPFLGVSFRDEFIGEVATSFVRPSQDIFFALFYYCAAVYGIVTGRLELEDTGSTLTHNMILHNVVLPLCAVLPLFCRFLQTLRQAYDDQRRWPHLGNAFKYLTASLVVFYAMTHNEEHRSTWWILCFAGCNVYQIWWDLVMDWELFELKYNSGSESCSMFGLLPFQCRMREERLYKSSGFYWKVALFNICCRFTWMLSFIPAYHLNLEGDIENTLSMDVKSIVGMLLSVTELLRRCCWGLLRLELETLKMTDQKYAADRVSSARIQYKWFAPKEIPSNATITATTVAMKKAAYRILVKRLFILELTCWVAVYIALGLWIAGLPNIMI